MDTEGPEEPSDAEITNQHVGSKALIEAINKIPNDLWALSPEDMERLIKPTKVTKDLRSAWVSTMKERLAGGKKITLAELANWAGCSYAQTHNLLIDRADILLWVIRPIGNDEVMARVGTERTLGELAEISMLPLDLEKGMSAYQLAMLKLKVFKMIYPIVHPSTGPEEKDSNQEK